MPDRGSLPPPGSPEPYSGYPEEGKGPRPSGPPGRGSFAGGYPDDELPPVSAEEAAEMADRFEDIPLRDPARRRKRPKR